MVIECNCKKCGNTIFFNNQPHINNEPTISYCTCEDREKVDKGNPNIVYKNYKIKKK